LISGRRRVACPNPQSRREMKIFLFEDVDVILIFLHEVHKKSLKKKEKRKKDERIRGKVDKRINEQMGCRITKRKPRIPKGFNYCRSDKAI